MKFRLILTAAFVFAALMGPILGNSDSSAQQLGTTAAGPERVYFSQTGQHLTGAFLDFWWENGGVPVFGFPVTGELQQDGMTVQYFERAVLEYHAENDPEWRVLLRRLGAHEATPEVQDHPAFDPSSDSGVGRYFPETQQNLHYGFLDHWEANGGLRIFGYPLSSEFQQDGMTVQYFERAVFEYHPDNPPEWRVLQPRMGAQAADEDGVDTSPKAQGDTPEYHPNLWSGPDRGGGGDKVVYLTFDDGPHETWTPRVLDVLEDYNANATFFVQGSQAAEHPGIVNDIARQGHGIGNHTYDHISLAGTSYNEFAWQVQATEDAVGDDMSSCLRPPFGRTDANTASFASQLGYELTMWDVDPRDWEQPGTGVIVDRVLSNVDPGDIVLMHDGGDEYRQQTVDALRQILPELVDRGYRFEAVCR